MKIPASIGYLEDRPTWRTLSADRRFRSALASQFLERLSSWALTIALVVLAYAFTERLDVVAGMMLLLIIPRVAAPAFSAILTRGDSCRRVSVLNFARGPLILSLVFVDSAADLYWAAVVVAALGVLGAALGELHGAALPSLTPHSFLPALNSLLGRLEQLAMVLAAGLVAGLLTIGDERATFTLAAVACLGAWLFMRLDRREWQVRDGEAAPPTAFQLRWTPGMSRVRLLILALFTGAVIGMGLRIALIGVVAAELTMTSAVYALLLAIVGLGAIFGPPLPVPRLLGRMPMAVIVSASLIALAVATSVVAWAGSLWIVAVALFVCGIIAVTVDMVVTAVARHVIPGTDVAAAMSFLAGAVIAGQILALAIIAGLSHIWGVAVALSSLSAFALVAAIVVAVVSRTELRRIAA